MKRLAVFLGLLLSLGFWPLVCQSQVTVSGSGSTKVVPNDPSTGTVLNGLAKVGPTGAIRTTPSDSNVPSWIVTGGAGTNQSVPAVMAVTGDVPCTMDVTLPNTRGMLVVVSPTNNQQCHPIPVTSPPSTGYAVGTMADNSTTAGQPALVSAQLINYQAGSGTGVGTITSVNFTPPSLFTASGVPVSSGAAAIVQAWQTQAANCVVAGPSTGAAAQPTCRPLVAADLVSAGVTTPTCAGDLTGTFPNCVVTKASTTFQLPGDVTPTSLTGNVGDYNGCDNTAICRLLCTVANCTVAGLQTGTDGRLLDVCNLGTANTITLPSLSGSASAPNQFDFGGTITLRPRACKLLWYDAAPGGSANKWRPMDSAPLDAYAIRTCDIPWGSLDTSAPAVSPTDDVVRTCLNNSGLDWQITAVSVYTDAGAPQMLPILTGGAANSILTGGTACVPDSPGVLKACSINGTPIVHSLSADGATCATPPCSIDGAQTADGVSHYMYLHVVGILR